MTWMRLSDRLLAFLAKGLSIHIGACDVDGQPELARALAVRAEPDGRLALLLPSVPGAPLLAAVAATGRLSVVLCQPTTHTAVQLRGRDAVREAADLAQWPELPRSHEAFLAEVQPFGFGRDFTSAWFEVPEAQMAVLRFVPTGAWDQTPGPGAGSPMELYAA